MGHARKAIHEDAKVCRNPRVSYRDLEEGGVLLHLGSGSYHGLNGTGTLIWKLLDAEPTLDRLIEEVRDNLEDPPHTIAEEVAEFVVGMTERDLVQLREA
jgi:hypothetical protein